MKPISYMHLQEFIRISEFLLKVFMKYVDVLGKMKDANKNNRDLTDTHSLVYDKSKCVSKGRLNFSLNSSFLCISYKENREVWLWS